MTDLLPRLEAIADRYNEVGKMITDPTVIADMKRYPQLMKEYKDLERGGVIDPIGTEFETTEARAALLGKLMHVSVLEE